MCVFQRSTDLHPHEHENPPIIHTCKLPSQIFREVEQWPPLVWIIFSQTLVFWTLLHSLSYSNTTPCCLQLSAKSIIFVCKTFIFHLFTIHFQSLINTLFFLPFQFFLAALHSVCGTHYCHFTGDGWGRVLRLLSGGLAAKEKFLVFCSTLVELTLKRWGLQKGFEE